MDQQITQNLLEIQDKLKGLLDNQLPQIILEINNTGGNKMAEKTEKKKKGKGHAYSDDIKKKCVSLFVAGVMPKDMDDELKKAFPGTRIPAIKARKRYIRAQGHKIGGK